jgi:dolichol-phosphate mannosyltransferase
MSQGINVYSRWLLGLTSRDCSGAYRCYRATILRAVPFDRFQSKGYAFQEEVLYRCRLAGARFVEVPFTFVDRQVGQSKINQREVRRALWDIFVLGMRRYSGRPA